MKINLIIPPALALVVVSGWIGSERWKISTLENESAVLKAQLSSRSADSGTGSLSAKGTAQEKRTKDKEPIDWKKVAAQMAESQGDEGIGDMRAMIRLQQRLQAMSKEELVAALDEIAALEMADEARQRLEQMLIGLLCQKDPQFGLTRYIDRLADDQGMMSWQLSNAMKEWMKKEPENAVAWFDQQIAAGKFASKSLDGKSQARMQFEGMVIGSLISTDPDAAAARLRVFPADQRADVLGNNTGNAIKETDQLAFANLVREQLPDREQAQVLAQHSSIMAYREGYTEITAYLDRIKATPAERAVCVEQAANSKIQSIAQNKKVTREDIDSLRDWATAQSPDTLDKVTGNALAQSIQSNKNLEFSEAAALASQYHDASGNDDVLVSFLSSGAGYNHKDQARLLAEKIADPKRREEILSRFK